MKVNEIGKTDSVIVGQPEYYKEVEKGINYHKHGYLEVCYGTGW